MICETNLNADSELEAILFDESFQMILRTIKQKSKQ